MNNQVIVTRHPALVSFLIEMGLADKSTPVIGHATPEAIKGKNVLGVLPLHLAVEAKSVTEVPMDIPPEMRGKELTIEQMRQYALTPRTYQVFEQI